jgi:hypothetical protein
MILIYLLLNSTVFNLVFFFKDKKRFAIIYIISRNVNHKNRLSFILSRLMSFDSNSFNFCEIVNMFIQKFVRNWDLIHVFYITEMIFLFCVLWNLINQELRITTIKLWVVIKQHPFGYINTPSDQVNTLFS